MVDLYDNKDEFLASGHYQEGSIAVRVLGFDPVEVDQQFWEGNGFDRDAPATEGDRAAR